MDNAANAMAAGRKKLTREEALGQEASSALLQGGTISDKVAGSRRHFCLERFGHETVDSAEIHCFDSLIFALERDGRNWPSAWDCRQPLSVNFLPN